MKLLIIILLFAGNLFATNYYVKNDGNDKADGLSDATAWKTIAKVNASKFQPGDNIYFKRGNMWREQLNVPSSGAPGAPITFGAYGSGPRPIINGADIITDWTKSNIGANIWATPTNGLDNGKLWMTVVVIDGTMFSPVSSLSQLTKAHSYWCGNDSVYIYSTNNPKYATAELSRRLSGVWVEDKHYIKIQDLYIKYAGYSGIEVRTGSYGNLIQNCHLYANHQAGIQFFNDTDIIRSNIAQDCYSEYNGNGYYANIADSTSFIRDIVINTISYPNYGKGSQTDGHGIGCYKANNALIEYCYGAKNQGGNVGYDSQDHLNNGIIRYNEFHGSVIGKILGCGSISTGSTLNVYYNKLIADTPMVAAVYYNNENGYLNFYNNTIIIKDSVKCAVRFSYANNVTFKNNIIYNSSKGARDALLWVYYSGTPKCDNNIWCEKQSTQVFARYRPQDPNGTHYSTLSDWQNATNQDINSLIADPLFTNPNRDDYTLGHGSPAINEGTNVGLTQDILGNPVVGKPDIGAYEHPFVITKLKVFLEGAYQNGTMTTNLNSGNLIPKKQPYNIPPWNYAGTESVSTVPPSVVDWVLVELRTGINKSSTIARRAGFLKSDGSIVDLDGNSPLKFDFIPKGRYYIVIRHRNHLAVMSAKPVMISDSTSLYDFTTSQSKAYGINPMVNLGNNVYGMYAGDGDDNGGVSSTDRNNVWRVENGKKGYLQGDYNLDGAVNDIDLNFYWSPRNGNITQVPN